MLIGQAPTPPNWTQMYGFWVSVASVIVALVVGIAGTRIAMRGGREPRRNLNYGFETKRLLSEHSGLTNLEVWHNAAKLAEPHLIDIQILLRGNVDVKSEHFDQNLPLKVSFGATIVDLLDRQSLPPGVQIPKVEIDGTDLLIGPSLLNKKHELRFSVLVDGKPNTQLSCPIAGTTPRTFAEIADKYQPFIDMTAVGARAYNPLAGAISETALRALVRTLSSRF